MPLAYCQMVLPISHDILSSFKTKKVFFMSSLCDRCNSPKSALIRMIILANTKADRWTIVKLVFILACNTARLLTMILLVWLTGSIMRVTSLAYKSPCGISNSRICSTSARKPPVHSASMKLLSPE